MYLYIILCAKLYIISSQSYIIYTRNFTSVEICRDIKGALGYKRSASFIHLSKYDNCCNTDMVNLFSFSFITVLTSNLTRSYTVNAKYVHIYSLIANKINFKSVNSFDKITVLVCWRIPEYPCARLITLRQSMLPMLQYHDPVII